MTFLSVKQTANFPPHGDATARVTGDGRVIVLEEEGEEEEEEEEIVNMRPSDKRTVILPAEWSTVSRDASGAGHTIRRCCQNIGGNTSDLQLGGSCGRTIKTPNEKCARVCWHTIIRRGYVVGGGGT